MLANWTPGVRGSLSNPGGRSLVMGMETRRWRATRLPEKPTVEMGAAKSKSDEKGSLHLPSPNSKSSISTRTQDKARELELWSKGSLPGTSKRYLQSTPNHQQAHRCGLTSKWEEAERRPRVGSQRSTRVDGQRWTHRERRSQRTRALGSEPDCNLPVTPPASLGLSLLICKSMDSLPCFMKKEIECIEMPGQTRASFPHPTPASTSVPNCVFSGTNNFQGSSYVVLYHLSRSNASKPLENKGSKYVMPYMCTVFSFPKSP